MFEFFFKVRGYELDSFGHVNNAVYLNYLEEARWDCLEKTGCMELFRENQSFLAVIDVHIRYIRELTLFQSGVVKTRVSLESPYLVFEQQIVQLESGKKSAKARVKLLHIDHQRIPMDIPEVMLKKLTGELI